MALVYRIERDDGLGPYSIGPNWGDEPPYDLNGRHPGPHDDSALRPIWDDMSYYMRDAYSFGFRDEAQMKAWFYRDEWLAILKKEGCCLTVWEVDDKLVHYGNCQAIFRKDKATLVGTSILI